VPAPAAATITGGVIKAMRRYFLGVTIVAAFNATVVGIGALVLDVPLAGTIAVVTFVTAYIPFVGAVVSGAFAVLLPVTPSPPVAPCELTTAPGSATGGLDEVSKVDFDRHPSSPVVTRRHPS